MFRHNHLEIIYVFLNCFGNKLVFQYIEMDLSFFMYMVDTRMSRIVVATEEESVGLIFNKVTRIAIQKNVLPCFSLNSP